MQRNSAGSPCLYSDPPSRRWPGLLAILLIAGCASSPPADEPVEEPAAPPPVAAKPSPPPPATPAPVTRQPSAPAPRLNPQHPDRYVVVKGDTLWDISEMFLKDPWFWPEIWYVNPQIANPHLIYPGDVISLVYIDGQPRLILERGSAARLSPRVREEPLADAILAIPYDQIKGFLSKPAVLDRDTAENSPYILTDRFGHLAHAAGTEVYARGAGLDEQSVFSVMRVGEQLRDPDTGKLLGYEGIYIGDGTIVRPGDPATMMLNTTRQEAQNGDRLLPSEHGFPLYFVPHSPDQEIDGSIISVFDGVSIIGSYQIVTLNRGSKHGLEPGHVLAVLQAGRVEKDRFADGWFPEKVKLPEENAGLLMVFRTFDDISYGLIVRATSEIRVLDKVRNP